jgi:Phosphopantetheine attachment site
MSANEPTQHSCKTPAPTSESLHTWLTSAVAQAAGLDPQAVNPDRPIAEYGLGSLLGGVALANSALTVADHRPSWT